MPKRSTRLQVPADPIEADQIYRARLRAALGEIERERFRAALVDGGAEGLRKIAQSRLQQGCYLIDSAFDLAHNPGCPWKFDERVQLEATNAIVTLIRLMRSPIELRAEAFAASDVEFQRFLHGSLPRAV